MYDNLFLIKPPLSWPVHTHLQFDVMALVVLVNGQCLKKCLIFMEQTLWLVKKWFWIGQNHLWEDVPPICFSKKSLKVILHESDYCHIQNHLQMSVASLLERSSCCLEVLCRRNSSLFFNFFFPKIKIQSELIKAKLCAFIGVYVLWKRISPICCIFVSTWLEDVSNLIHMNGEDNIYL